MKIFLFDLAAKTHEKQDKKKKTHYRRQLYAFRSLKVEKNPKEAGGFGVKVPFGNCGKC